MPKVLVFGIYLFIYFFDFVILKSFNYTCKQFTIFLGKNSINKI